MQASHISSFVAVLVLLGSNKHLLESPGLPPASQRIPTRWVSYLLEIARWIYPVSQNPQSSFILSHASSQHQPFSPIAGSWDGSQFVQNRYWDDCHDGCCHFCCYVKSQQGGCIWVIVCRIHEDYTSKMLVLHPHPTPNIHEKGGKFLAPFKNIYMGLFNLLTDFVSPFIWIIIPHLEEPHFV